MVARKMVIITLHVLCRVILTFTLVNYKGWRESNEDTYIEDIDIEMGMSLFGIFDGHGGCGVSVFAERHFK